MVIGGGPLPWMDLEFQMADVDLWEQPVPVRPLLPQLSFVEDRLMQYWGLYFRKATRKLDKKDYDTMIRAHKG